MNRYARLSALSGIFLLGMTMTGGGCGQSASEGGSGGSGGASSGSGGSSGASAGDQLVGSGGAAQGSGGSVDTGSGGTSEPGTGGGETSGSGGTGTSGGGGPTSTGTGGTGTGGAGTGGTSGGPNDGGATAPVDASSGGSGGTGGTGGPSSDAGSTPAKGCASGLLLCDDFESYATGSSPNGQWRLSGQGSSTIVVDTMHARGGTKAAHFHGTVGKDGANAVYITADQAPVFPVKGNSLYIRFTMYIQRYATGSPMHTRLVWIGTTGMARNQNSSGYVMNTYNGIAIEHLTGSGLRDTSQHLTDAVNTGKWLCWEWELDNTAGPPPQSTGTVMGHMWREGKEMSLAISGTGIEWAPVPWNQLQFALFAYQADTEPADFWIDDIAMSNQRIGCPQ